MKPPSADPALWTLRARALFAAAMVLLMFGGPLYKQVLGGKSKWIRTWVMYRSFGLDICEVDFWEERGGERVPIDRYEVYGYDGLGDAPKSFRRLQTHRSVGLHARKLCYELGSHRDLRVRASCAAQSGWEPVYRGEVNVCGSKFVVPPRADKGRR